MWKGQGRLEKLSKNPPELIANFRPKEEKHTLKCGTLNIHGDQGISVEIVILTALVVQARAEKLGK